MQQTPSTQLESYYNFKDLCHAVLRKDIPQAMAILDTQSQCLFQDGPCSDSVMMVFLTSMNRSIYNYLLFALDVSLHECCSQNSVMTHKCQTKEQFFQAARQMILAYCGQFDCVSGCNPHIMKAKEYIEQNLVTELTLKQVAAYIPISPSYLSELFTSYVGKSFSCYVKERRLEHARQLLLTSRGTVQDVGFACGFQSSSYFSTAFTQWAGISPRQFRSQAKTTSQQPS